MKLLMLVHRLPFPPDRGVKLRAARELNWLSRQHQVWVAGFTDSQASVAPAAALAGIRDLCAIPLCRPVAAWNAGCSMLAGRTASEGYFSSAALTRQVMRWAEKVDFDAVLAFSSSMAPLALRVPARRRVLDMVDVDSRKWLDSAEAASGPMRHVYRTEGRRLAGRELDWINAFDATVLVSGRERESLWDRHLAGPTDRLEAGPTGVLSDRVHVLTIEAGLEASAAAEPAPLPDEPTVGFLGAMDYGPNVDAACWFAESIWPRVRAQRPDANWWIVGRSPTPVVQRLANVPGVHVTGTVPAVEPYLDRMRVNVAPVRLARGLQNKVLAAMSAGRPCVVTSCVADGLGVRDGEHVLVADNPEAFAQAVTELLSDRGKAELIGNAGREFVARTFDPSAALTKLEALLMGSGDEARATVAAQSAA